MALTKNTLQKTIFPFFVCAGSGSGTGFISPNDGAVYQGNNSSSWSTTSDRRIKKNIVDNTVGLDAINQVQVKNFEYRTEDEITEVPSHARIPFSLSALGYPSRGFAHSLA